MIKYLLILLLAVPCFADSFESVCVISDDDGAVQEVYVIVNRTVDSNTVRYVEQFQPIDWGTDANDIYFVDCGTDANDTLTHLEGEEVVVWGDGVPDQNTYTVSSGAITTDTSYTNETIGLAYTSIYESMPLNKLSERGSSVAKRTRIINVMIDFYESLAANIGVEDNTEIIEFSTDSFATVLDPVTELKNILFPLGVTREPVIYIDVNEPVPMTIRGLYPRLEITED